MTLGTSYAAFMSPEKISLYEGSRKKLFFSGPVTKRGWGVKAGPLSPLKATKKRSFLRLHYTKSKMKVFSVSTLKKNVQAFKESGSGSGSSSLNH